MSYPCEVPTKKYPNGRTGTRAGYEADRKAGNGICNDCREAQHKVTIQHSGKDKITEVLETLKNLAEDTENKIPEHKIKRGWRNKAACKGKTNLFFSVEIENLKLAAQICSSCPVRIDCAKDSQGENFGMWGGVSSRVKLACASPTSQYPDGRTGTMAGMMAHSRAKESACSACLAAQRDERVIASAGAPV